MWLILKFRELNMYVSPFLNNPILSVFRFLVYSVKEAEYNGVLGGIRDLEAKRTRFNAQTLTYFMAG